MSTSVIIHAAKDVAPRGIRGNPLWLRIAPIARQAIKLSYTPHDVWDHDSTMENIPFDLDGKKLSAHTPGA
jgi:hypothetical protein